MKISNNMNKIIMTNNSTNNNNKNKKNSLFNMKILIHNKNNS